MNERGVFLDEEVFTAIRKELMNLGCISKTKAIRLGDSLYTDLSVDSLELVDLVMNLERKFHVDVNDENMDALYDGKSHGLITVQDLVHLIMGRNPMDYKSIKPAQVVGEQVVYAS